MQPSALSQKMDIAFELKGSLITLTVLHLLNPDIHAFTVQLRKHAQRTPNLFKNMPVVIDLQRAGRAEVEIDFAAIQHHLRQHGLIPVGVRHGNVQQNAAAEAAGLALLSTQTNHISAQKTKTSTEKSAATDNPHTLLITKPIRSGQQVYARKGDLIVTASVSHGAELLADGNIHVYGNLRGRALAGVTGDKTARIFCHKLEAELVSIAGYYKLHDDLPEVDAISTQVYLDEDKLHFEPLGD